LTTTEEIPPMLDQIRFVAGAARLLEGRSAGEYIAGRTSYLRREPVGAIRQVTPWNYPMMMAVQKVAPAIAAGNTPTQRLKLARAVALALEAGWTPSALAAFTGANTDGVRSPYAVLTARLSPAELPPPPARSARPSWCGPCDQVTRMLDYHGDAPRPCPRCKPAAYAHRDRPGRDGPTASITPHASQAGMGARTARKREA
jgi:hypothetical protein